MFNDAVESLSIDNGNSVSGNVTVKKIWTYQLDTETKHSAATWNTLSMKVKRTSICGQHYTSNLMCCYYTTVCNNMPDLS